MAVYRQFLSLGYAQHDFFGISQWEPGRGDGFRRKRRIKAYRLTRQQRCWDRADHLLRANHAARGLDPYRIRTGVVDGANLRRQRHAAARAKVAMSAP